MSTQGITRYEKVNETAITPEAPSTDEGKAGISFPTKDYNDQHRGGIIEPVERIPSPSDPSFWARKEVDWAEMATEDENELANVFERSM